MSWIRLLAWWLATIANLPIASAMDDPPRWMPADGVCPWSAADHGLCGRIVSATWSAGEVFLELKNVTQEPLTVPWFISCHDAPLLHPLSGLLPNGLSGRPIAAAAVVGLRWWGADRTWTRASWPGPALPAPAQSPVTPVSAASRPLDLMATVRLEPGQSALCWVAGRGLETTDHVACALDLHGTGQSPGDWVGTLQLGPSPWNGDPSLGAMRSALPMLLPPLADVVDDLTREQGEDDPFHQLWGHNAALASALFVYDPSSVVQRCIARSHGASESNQRILYLFLAAQTLPNDEALRELAGYLDPPRTYPAVVHALRAFFFAARWVPVPAAAVKRLITASESGDAVATQVPRLGPFTLAYLVTDSQVLHVLLTHRNPTYLAYLHQQLHDHPGLDAAYQLSFIGDAAGKDLIMQELRRDVAQLLAHPQQRGQDTGPLDRAIWHAGDLHLREAVPLLLTVLPQHWTGGWCLDALTEIGDPRAIPVLQDLQDHLDDYREDGAPLAADEVQTRRGLIAVALACIAPHDPERLFALLKTYGANAQVAERLGAALGDPLDLGGIPYLQASMRTAVLYDTCWNCCIALRNLHTVSSIHALIECLSYPCITRAFTGHRISTDNLGHLIASCLRDATGLSIGDDAASWEAWWQGVGCHLLGP